MSLGNVYLTDDLIRAVRETVDIVEITSDHTRLKRGGRRWAGLCPLHKEKTPSFSVDPDQGLFYCFGCGQGGDAIKLHMLLSGDDFAGAIETLARRYGIPLPSRPQGRRSGPREPDLEPVLESALTFYRTVLGRSEGPLRYLEERKISAELVEQFELGYAAAGWKNLLGELHPRHSLEDLGAAGLIGRSERRGGEPYDRFRERLIFPIRDTSGRLVGFGGRTMADDRAKYINTAETARFHKSRILYGLHGGKRAARELGRVVLAEGYFDVIGLQASGVEGAVASMGTSLTPEQAKLMARFADEVVIAYDGDTAGVEAARRALVILLDEGLTVRQCQFPEGEDPDSLRLAEGEEAVRRAIEGAPDAVRLEIDARIPRNAASEPQVQARSAQDVGELLKHVRDSVLRFSYGREAAGRLGLPVEVFWKQISAGGATAPPPQAATTAPVGATTPGPVQSLEERVLQLLLSGGEDVPPIGELPDAGVFMDRGCRNIFEAFCALYEGEGACPSAQKVLGRLAGEGAEVDRVARLLLETSVAPRAGELSDSISRISRRWMRQREKELIAEINEAQLSGDVERIERLVEEKTSISRSRHGR